MMTGALVTQFDERPGLPAYVFGGVVLALTGGHLYTRPGPGKMAVGRVMLPALFATTFFYAGYRFRKRDLSGQQVLRITTITLLFGAIGVLLTGFVVGMQRLQGGSVEGASAIVLTGWVGAAAVGPLVGYYHTMLHDEYERTRRLNRRLNVVQRVLRHNLRNELTVLFGQTNALDEQPLNAEADRHVTEIDAHLEELAQLSDTASTLSRVWETAGSETTHELGALVTECVRDVRAAYPESAITVDAPRPTAVRAHPQLDAAVREAITNGVKHDDGTPEVHVSVDRLRDGVRIHVHDTGPGVPAVEVAALEQQSETPIRHGSGLGLWLIYWVVEASGGELTVEGNDPTGTVVTMTLQ